MRPNTFRAAAAFQAAPDGQKLLTIVARNVALTGFNAAPEKLHNLTATVFAALTRIVPINPASRPPGQPGATESPAAAPVSPKVNSPHPTDAMLGKSRVAEAAR